MAPSPSPTPDRRIALTLMFASDDNPSSVATRVGEVVAAEVATPLTGMNWTAFDLSEDDESDEPDWEAIAKQREQERDEARSWARHGYEIGQKHCSWSDHGVAPTWLTEGWPPHIGSCEHLKKAAEYDEALTRVRAESDRIRATTRTWEPVADLIDAAIEGPIREQRERPTHPDGTPYRYHEAVAEGWGYCDGCKLWSTGTPRRPHQCAETHMQGPSQEGA